MRIKTHNKIKQPVLISFVFLWGVLGLNNEDAGASTAAFQRWSVGTMKGANLSRLQQSA